MLIIFFAAKPNNGRSCGFAALACPRSPTGVNFLPMKRTIALATALLFSLPLALAQDLAKQTLEKSPRHQEWVQIKHDNRVVQAFVVYPESKKRAPFVFVIHDIFCLRHCSHTLATYSPAQTKFAT